MTITTATSSESIMRACIVRFWLCVWCDAVFPKKLYKKTQRVCVARARDRDEQLNCIHPKVWCQKTRMCEAAYYYFYESDFVWCLRLATHTHVVHIVSGIVGFAIGLCVCVCVCDGTARRFYWVIVWWPSNEFRQWYARWDKYKSLSVGVRDAWCTARYIWYGVIRGVWLNFIRLNYSLIMPFFIIKQCW